MEEQQFRTDWDKELLKECMLHKTSPSDTSTRISKPTLELLDKLRNYFVDTGMAGQKRKNTDATITSLIQMFPEMVRLTAMKNQLVDDNEKLMKSLIDTMGLQKELFDSETANHKLQETIFDLQDTIKSQAQELEDRRLMIIKLVFGLKEVSELLADALGVPDGEEKFNQAIKECLFPSKDDLDEDMRVILAKNPELRKHLN